MCSLQTLKLSFKHHNGFQTIVLFLIKTYYVTCHLIFSHWLNMYFLFAVMQLVSLTVELFRAFLLEVRGPGMLVHYSPST